uniref:hypothetical protein n=1 Tax=Pseudonocardia sp. CA-138482 TaxID=3240023 RepID=UPI003F4975D7
MPRLLSPDDPCKEVDVPIGAGRRYRGTIIDVADPAHVRALRRAGYTVADVAGVPTRAAGFECGACGRRNYFRRCGRCGRDPAA